MSLELRTEIVATCRKLNAMGLNQGTSGNISVRAGEGYLLTPSGMDYDLMQPDDIVPMSFEGSYAGNRVPSTEWRFHRDILTTPFWQTLLFDVFPDINVDPKPFFRILAAPSCQSNVPPPAPVPTATPPAAAAATPVPPRQSRAARPPLPRKRGATGAREEEEEEEEGQVRPQQEEPPKRYKPYTGPQLYVLE
jgi:hypothetical protein